METLDPIEEAAQEYEDALAELEDELDETTQEFVDDLVTKLLVFI